MGAEELVVVEDVVPGAAEVVIDVLPGAVDVAAEGLALGLAAGHQGGEVDQAVLEQLQLGERLAAVVHRLEGDEDVDVALELVDVEEEALRQGLEPAVAVGVGGALDALVEERAGGGEVGCIGRLGALVLERRLAEDPGLEVFVARVVLGVPEQVRAHDAAGLDDVLPGELGHVGEGEGLAVGEAVEQALDQDEPGGQSLLSVDDVEGAEVPALDQPGVLVPVLPGEVGDLLEGELAGVVIAAVREPGEVLPEVRELPRAPRVAPLVVRDPEDPAVEDCIEGLKLARHIVSSRVMDGRSWRPSNRGWRRRGGCPAPRLRAVEGEQHEGSDGEVEGGVDQNEDRGVNH